MFSFMKKFVCFFFFDRKIGIFLDFFYYCISTNFANLWEIFPIFQYHKIFKKEKKKPSCDS